MSTQKGNAQRTRPQRHKNSKAFKNDLFDKTPRVKLMNSIEIADVCSRCKSIIEWKIKYKKYKPMTVQKRCTKCNEKCIKYAYHTVCGPCSKTHAICGKCGKKPEEGEIVRAIDVAEIDRQNAEIEKYVKTLPERKRRTFFRYLAKKEKGLLPEEESSIESTKKKLQELKDMCKKLESEDELSQLDDLFLNSSDDDLDDM